MDTMDILAIIKVVALIWMGIVMFLTYRYIKKVISMIPRCVFEKTKKSYRIVIKAPKKAMKFISKIGKK